MNNHIEANSQVGAQSPRSVGGCRCWLMSAAGFAAFATGCGSDESENIGTSQAAFSVSSCASVDADQTFAGKVDPAFVTPRSYNTCYKGYVVDIENLQTAYTGQGTVQDARIAIGWADTPITSQTTCEATRMLGYFYERGLVGAASVNTSGTTGEYTEDVWISTKVEEQYGHWFSAFGGSCSFEVNLTGLVSGTTYRVAATARTPGNSTRKVSIGTYRPINLQ